jgi:hypothetical protein
MKRPIFFSIAVAIVLGMCASSYAYTPTGYDVRNAQPPGFGNWNHYYTGNTDTQPSGLLDYTGGTGTMANGVIETSPQQIQLFTTQDNPVITLYLGGTFNISDISLDGGDFMSNYIPGTLTGWTVGIGNTSVQYVSQGFGNSCTSDFCSDVVYTGQTQRAIATNQIVLSNFTGGWFGDFSIAEISFNGSPVSPTNQVPEPTTMLLLGLGLMGLAGVRRKFRK